MYFPEFHEQGLLCHPEQPLSPAVWLRPRWLNSLDMGLPLQHLEKRDIAESFWGRSGAVHRLVLRVRFLEIKNLVERRRESEHLCSFQFSVLLASLTFAPFDL